MYGDRCTVSWFSVYLQKHIAEKDRKYRRTLFYLWITVPCSYITSSPVMGHSVPLFDPSSKHKLTSWKSPTSVQNIRCRMAAHVGSEFLDAVPYQCCIFCSILLQKEVAKLGIVVWPDQPYSSGIIYASLFLSMFEEIPVSAVQRM